MYSLQLSAAAMARCGAPDGLAILVTVTGIMTDSRGFSSIIFISGSKVSERIPRGTTTSTSLAVINPLLVKITLKTNDSPILNFSVSISLGIIISTTGVGTLVSNFTMVSSSYTSSTSVSTTSQV